MAIATYNEATRKLLTAFGDLFNNITIHRNTTNGYKPVKLPIHFAPASYDYLNILEHPNLTNIKPSINLPLLTFEITRMELDSSRKENRYFTKTSCIANANGTFDVIRSPTPFIVNFSLYLYTHYLDDVYEVQERIFTGFNPKVTVQIKQDNGIVTQVPITFSGISKTDNYEGSPKDKSRLIMTTFSFDAKMYFYRTSGETAEVIKKITLNYDYPPSSQIDHTTEIKVDPIDADVTDNWTIIVTNE